MFKLEVTKANTTVEMIYQMNRNEDDFIQFIPKLFNVPKEAIDIYMIDDDNHAILESALATNKELRSLDMSEAGIIKVIESVVTIDEITLVETEEITIIESFTGVAINYPYDAEGKFLGNGSELL